MIIDPAEQEDKQIYKLLIGAVVPRPIAFISSMSNEGKTNLAPFSFFTVASVAPPVVCFTPLFRPDDGSTKDTLRNIRATKEFVLNIVSEEFAEQMDLCSKHYPPAVSEFEISGLTPVTSTLVKPPRVKEAKICMECSLRQIVEVSARPLGGSMILGNVLRIHVADEIVDDFRIDPAKLRPIGRMGGPLYTRTTDLFELGSTGSESKK